MEELFKKLFESYHQRHAIRTIVAGVAKEVNDKTCKVVREGQPDMLDVRLNAVEADLNTNITIKPKENSYVLVGIIENTVTEAVVIATSEIESVQIKTNDLLFEMKDGKFSISKGADGLGKCINDLIIQIQAIYAPKNSAAITLIQNRFNAFLNA